MAGFNPIKLFGAAHTFLYRRTNGAIGGKLMGMPMLLLTTTGRKSGRAITQPLTYLQDRESYIIIASNNGRDRNPLWYQNLRAKPDVEIQVGSNVMNAFARPATPDEAKQIWPRVDAVYPQYKGYRNKTTREIPIVRVSPT
jgi:deazaflavin-dependent oxidoreductase (nitroreductase family)